MCRGESTGLRFCSKGGKEILPRVGSYVDSVLRGGTVSDGAVTCGGWGAGGAFLTYEPTLCLETLNKTTTKQTQTFPGRAGPQAEL